MHGPDTICPFARGGFCHQMIRLHICRRLGDPCPALERKYLLASTE
jgi:hypothetical protein